MGLYFRKSAGLGPIRLNFSKSGIGVSTGVKGARLVFSPKGTYVHIGRNGLFYKKYISFKDNQDINSKKSIEPSTIHHVNKNQNIIETVNFDNLTDIDSYDFVKELENKDNKVSYFNIFLFLGLVGLIIFLFYFFIPYDYKRVEIKVVKVKNDIVNIRSENNVKSKKIIQVQRGDELIVLNDSIQDNWIFVTTGKDSGFIYTPLVEFKNKIVSSTPINRFNKNEIFGYTILSLIFGVWLAILIKMYYIDKRRKKIELYYDLDDQMNNIYEKLLSSFNPFLNVKKVWQIRTSTYGLDKKYHGGASTSVGRDIISQRSQHKLPMKYLITNAIIPFIGLKNIELYFLPERLLIKKIDKYASIMYKNIKFYSSDIHFVEEGAVPIDSKIIDYTWKYVNRKGDPDKRFSNNKQFPICIYSNYYIESEDGLNEIIQTSKTGALKEFEDSIKMISNIQNGKLSPSSVDICTLNDEWSNFINFLTEQKEFTFIDLQLKLSYGYSRANKIIDLLLNSGVVEKSDLYYKINHEILKSIKEEFRKYFG